MGMIRETLGTIKWVNPLIGLRELRGINSNNGVSTMVSVIFYYGIIIGMIRETVLTYKWVDPLIGLRGLRGINCKNGISSIKCHILLWKHYGND